MMQTILTTPIRHTHDTAKCQTKPMGFQGSIQPHGVLLVIESTSKTIEAVSQSCETLLGMPACQLLGRTLGQVFGPLAEPTLLEPAHDGLQPLTSLTRNGRRFSAKSCQNDAGQILVDIEPSELYETSMEGLTYLCRRGLDTLRRLDNSAEIYKVGAEVIRTITGFDQVMICRFDADYRGEVIAESTAENVESYLGCHLTASDIPQQDRHLLKLCRVRMIPDVRYHPSALLTNTHSPSVDMGVSGLRCVLPSHIKCLKNMGPAPVWCLRC